MIMDIPTLRAEAHCLYCKFGLDQDHIHHSCANVCIFPHFRIVYYDCVDSGCKEVQFTRSRFQGNSGSKASNCGVILKGLADALSKTACLSYGVVHKVWKNWLMHSLKASLIPLGLTWHLPYQVVPVAGGNLLIVNIKRQ